MFEGISKTAFAVVSLAALGIAGWMMASRNDAVRQLESVQMARDGAIQQVKELSAKVSELEGKVAGSETAKNVAEEAFKKIEEVISAERAKLTGEAPPAAAPEAPAAEAPAATEPAAPAAETPPATSEAPAATAPETSPAATTEAKPEEKPAEEAKPEEAKPERGQDRGQARRSCARNGACGRNTGCTYG